MHVDRGSLKEDYASSVRSCQMKTPQYSASRHQTDKTATRFPPGTIATGATRDEQLGDHKTFLKTPRWVKSLAATGKSARRARCRFARARVRAEESFYQQRQAPPDMKTGLRREVPTDHEADSHTQRGQLRELVSYALSNTVSAGRPKRYTTTLSR